MIELFYGKDTYRLGKRVEERTVRDKAEVFNYDDSVRSELFSNLISQSFFSPLRVFVVRGLLGKLDSKEEKSLLTSLQNLPDKTDVIFIEEKLPAKSKLIDYIKKEGKIEAFEDPKSTDLVSFIKERVAEEGGEIAPLAVERLASYVGPDFWQLSEEIKKLVLFKIGENESEAIDTADVDLLVRANFEAKIFSLMDAVAARNKRRSTELLNSFLESGENELYILTMIEKQFENIAMAKFEPHVTEALLSKKAGLHPFVAKKSIQQARNFEKIEITEMFMRLADADLKLKSGFEPKQVLLRLLV